MNNSSCSCKGNSLCPTHRCRNTTCLKPVHYTAKKPHYYCMNHMNCGNVANGHPCKGCLNTFQTDDKFNVSNYK